ncbi:MAG: HIT domain-containing protein [Candidatus Berkelbacteria bacterium]|nr:HIT domain-containing protein [Candidatus Berkelbacteria bacterium]
MKKECIFCKIINHEASARIEYEDKDVIAFWDINPSAPTHVLVAPKKHIKSINELENKDIISKMMFTAKKIAKAKKIAQSGYRLVINTGPWSGQIVDHLHLHLL